MKPLELIFYQTVISSLLTFPYTVILQHDINLFSIATVFIVTVMNTLLALYLWYDALTKISVSTASALSYLDPVFACIYAYIFLNQIPSIMTIAGGAMIIIGGVIASVKEVGSGGAGYHHNSDTG